VNWKLLAWEPVFNDQNQLTHFLQDDGDKEGKIIIPLDEQQKEKIKCLHSFSPP
jgi:hypothetical protein